MALMVQARRSHAVSVVQVADVEQYCTAQSNAGGHHFSWLQSALTTLLLTLMMWPWLAFNKYSYQRNRSTQKILVKKVCGLGCWVGVGRCKALLRLFIFTPRLDELPCLQLGVFLSGYTRQYWVEDWNFIKLNLLEFHLECECGGWATVTGVNAAASRYYSLELSIVSLLLFCLVYTLHNTGRCDGYHGQYLSLVYHLLSPALWHPN